MEKNVLEEQYINLTYIKTIICTMNVTADVRKHIFLHCVAYAQKIILLSMYIDICIV